MGRGTFEGMGGPLYSIDSAVSCAKMAKPIEMPFGCGLRWVQGSIGGGALATWRTWLNRPGVAAMRPFCQITLSTCCYY